MAILRIATSVRTAMADAAVDAIDAGAGAGTVEIRTGTQPTNPNTAASGTLLATLTCTDPAFGAASSGVATAAAITGDTSADATGTAGYFRVKDSSGNAIMDGDITVTGGGGTMTMATVSIVAGGTVDITSWTVTMPVG